MKPALGLRRAALVGSVACGVVLLLGATFAALAAFLARPGTSFDGDPVVTGWATVLACVAVAVALASGAFGIIAAGVAHRDLASARPTLHVTTAAATASVALAGISISASPHTDPPAAAALIVISIMLVVAAAAPLRDLRRITSTPAVEGATTARLVLVTAGLAAVTGGLIYLPFCLDAAWDRGEVVGGGLLAFTGAGVTLIAVAALVPPHCIATVGKLLVLIGLSATGAGLAGIATSFPQVLWVTLGLVAATTGTDLMLLAATHHDRRTPAPLTVERTLPLAATALPLGIELLSISTALLIDNRLTTARWSAGLSTDTVLAGLAAAGLATLSVGLLAWHTPHSQPPP